MTSTAQFHVIGKLSRSEYVFNTHSLLAKNEGDYPCFAAALFGPEHPDEIFAFALVKCRVFPIDAKCTTFIHAFRVFLVSKTMQWVGCVGVAEYDKEPNFENVDLLLNVNAYFSVLPYSEKFVYYREDYWAACRIPLRATPKQEPGEEEEEAEERSKKNKAAQGAKRPLMIGFELPPQGEADVPKESAECRLPVQVQHIRFPFPKDDMWMTDFFPLHLPSDQGMDWKTVDAEILKSRFWFLFREDEKNPNKVFPSVFHQFALHVLAKETEDQEEIRQWIEKVFGDAANKKIHGVAYIRNELPVKYQSLLLDEWSKQSADRNSALNRFRFERFDFFFERIGESILENLPWGTYYETWIFEHPLLESTYREIFLWYVVDHCLQQGGAKIEKLHIRHAKRIYEEWDNGLLRDFMIHDLCSPQIEKKIWKEYKLLFFADVDAENVDKSAVDDKDWLFGEFVSLLSKKELQSGVSRLSKKNEHSSALNRSLRAAMKKCMVRDIVRGKVEVEEYLKLVQ